MECIICGDENQAKSLEHIVSESLGNTSYIMERSRICDDCNGRFAKFERDALSHTIFLMVRARYGIKTKAGKPASGKIGDLEIKGDKDFKPQSIFVKNLDLSKQKDFDPVTKTFSLHVPSFHKTEVPTSKMLLKTAIESLYTSQRDLYKKHTYQDLKEFLQAKSNIDWPFLTSPCSHLKFSSIPKFTDKYNLKKIHCELSYCELNSDILLFKFKYGEVEMVINLLNRDLKWAVDCLDEDAAARLYPIHYRTKVEKIKSKPIDKIYPNIETEQ